VCVGVWDNSLSGVGAGGKGLNGKSITEVVLAGRWRVDNF